jgi:hypothetical protein
VTRRRVARRIQTTKGSGDIRAEWLALRTATGFGNPGSFRGQSLPDTYGGLDTDRPEGRKPDNQPPSLHDSITGRYSVLSGLSDAGNSSTPPSAEGGLDSPDLSGEFQSEMAALRAYYAARIGAARRSQSAGDISAIVQAILNEQTVALRALAERWRAAAERQKQEKPQRPAGNVQRRDDGQKPL